MAYGDKCEFFSAVLDGMRFPSLNGQSPSPTVGSVEEDSHCMSFAQVCMTYTHTSVDGNCPRHRGITLLQC